MAAISCQRAQVAALLFHPNSIERQRAGLLTRRLTCVSVVESFGMTFPQLHPATALIDRVASVMGAKAIRTGLPGIVTG